MSAETLRGMPHKRRRWTQTELAELDDALMAIVSEENPVTVRRGFYAATSTGLVDKTEAGYDVVQRRLLSLRRSGRMPYAWIADNTRYVVAPRSYDDLADAVRTTAALYKRNLWADQADEVHLFTEKEALLSVIDPVTWDLQVPLGVMRGCSSESFIYEIAERVKRINRNVYFYQLGDHDPTGVMAWDKFAEGVRRFAPDAPVHFERIAVTPEQISSMNLPTRPTKKSDSRAANFVGDSVEVDAIPAPTLREIVQSAIEQHLDERQLDVTRMVERQERASLFGLASQVGGDAA